MIESLLSNNTSNRFKFIMTPNLREKPAASIAEIEQLILLKGKPMAVDNMLF